MLREFRKKRLSLAEAEAIFWEIYAGGLGDPEDILAALGTIEDRFGKDVATNLSNKIVSKDSLEVFMANLRDRVARL